MVAGAVVILPAACGGDDSAGAGDSGARSSSTEPAGEDAECREVEHVAGTACVPADPQRIVALDSLTVLPTLLELDAPVAGALSVYSVGSPFPSYLDADAVAGIEVVGDLQTPNVEAIAALRPDLIIGTEPVVTPILAELEAIAPTVVTRYTFYESGWRDDVRVVADAVDRLDEVEERFGALDERIAEVRAGLEAQGGSHSLTRLDVFQGMPIYYRLACTWFGEVLLAAGVTQPEAQGPEDCTDGDYQSVLVYPSLEELEVLDADVIVAYQQQAGADDVGADPLTALEATPLWSGLAAVQAGRVHVLGDAWGIGGSITSALQILDDLETTVFPEEP